MKCVADPDPDCMHKHSLSPSLSRSPYLELEAVAAVELGTTTEPPAEADCKAARGER